MMHKQDFRVKKIFQKREQFTGYHRLIPLQNVPTFDVAGILVPPVLSFWTLELKALKNNWEIFENSNTGVY